MLFGQENHDGPEAETAAATKTTTVAAGGAVTGGYWPMNTNLRIVGPNFVAGLIISNDRVIRAAPILGYAIGWTTERVSALAQRRGWSIEHDQRQQPNRVAQR